MMLFMLSAKLILFFVFIAQEEKSSNSVILVLIWNLWFWALLCLVTQSRPILCDPTNCSLPGSFVHADSPGKNTGVGCHALPPGALPPPRDQTQVSCIAGDSLPPEPPGKLLWALQRHPFPTVVESCLTLCDTMDCSPPGSSVHGISQAKILVAISFFRGSSRPRDQSWVSCIFCIGRWILYH